MYVHCFCFSNASRVQCGVQKPSMINVKVNPIIIMRAGLIEASYRLSSKSPFKFSSVLAVVFPCRQSHLRMDRFVVWGCLVRTCATWSRKQSSAYNSQKFSLYLGGFLLMSVFSPSLSLVGLKSRKKQGQLRILRYFYI